MAETLEKLYTIAEVTENLRVGRTFLLDFLRKNPLHNGTTTHRRIGNKILFTAGDYQALLEAISCHSKSSAAKARNTSTSAGPSEDKKFLKAQALLTPARPKDTGSNGKRRSGNVVSMERARSQRSRMP